MEPGPQAKEPGQQSQDALMQLRSGMGSFLWGIGPWTWLALDTLLYSAILHTADVLATWLLGSWKGHIFTGYLLLRTWTKLDPEIASASSGLFIYGRPYLYQPGGANLVYAIDGIVNNGCISLPSLAIAAEPWLASKSYTILACILRRHHWKVVTSLLLAALFHRVIKCGLGAKLLSAVNGTAIAASEPIVTPAEEYTFTYQPLSPNQSIRVLVLHPPYRNSALPNNETDDLNPAGIRCSIEHIRLGERKYDALSYCWGDPIKRRRIVIDGTLVSVTQNLYSALARVRDEVATPVCLWADAVCINQGDASEKAHQIPLMREIYTDAEQVWIWLGESTPGDEDEGGWEFANFLEKTSHTDRTPPEQKYVWAFPSVDVPPPTDERWASFFAIFSRPWFSRLWIVQEVVLAKNPVFLCGRSRLSWDSLNKAFDYTGVLGIQGLAKGHEQMHVLKNCRALHSARTPLSLSKLLVRTQACKATEPRDKIYGILGLADSDDPVHRSVIPNYQIPTEHLYRDVAIRSIQTSKTLDIFQAIRSHDNNNLVLPSWVPDWSRTDRYVPLRYSELAFPDNAVPEIQSQHFRAAGDSVALPDLTFASSDGTTLGLRGHSIGVLHEVSRMIPRGTGINTAYDSINALKDLERVAGVSSESGTSTDDTYPFTGEPIADCYWQTLCAGIMPGGFEMSQGTFHRHNAMTQTLHAFIIPLERYAPSRLAKTTWLRGLVLAAACMFHAMFRSLTIVQDIADFQGNLGATEGRRVARTNNGHVCLVPGKAERGDRIVLLEGGKAPIVIRRDMSGPQSELLSSTERWVMLGEAYVHGATKGEAFLPEECRWFYFG